MSRHTALATAIPGYARGQVLSLPGDVGRTVDPAGGTGRLSRRLLVGRRDMGLVAMSKLLRAVQLIREISELQLLVDADTGFGNAENAAALHPLPLLHGFIRQGPNNPGVPSQMGSTASLKGEIGDLAEFNALFETATRRLAQ